MEHLSNEELGLSLLLGELPYDPQAIRISEQLLSGEVDVEKVLFIAEQERLEFLLNRMANDILSFGMSHLNWEKSSFKPEVVNSLRQFYLIQHAMF